MTNSIFIDVDTERDRPVIFSKPPHIDPPQTKEEAGKMIVNDIATVSHALKYLIMIASDNGYANKSELIDGAIKTLNELNENNKTNENV
jgi:hypothetical protein